MARAASILPAAFILGPKRKPRSYAVMPLPSPQPATSIKARNPIPRVGSEGELKGVAVFLASDASNYITGQVIVVDGGRTIV